MPPRLAPHPDPVEYRFIDQADDLAEVVPALLKQPAIGVDLECDSMFHYKEKVCLIQIATPLQNMVIDPLSVKDLSPLAPVFAHPRIEKVLHGADYDIRSLYRDFRIRVHTLFDTQIAARFLSIRETGLASLLKARFSVLTDKKYQKKDWSKRPLPEPMIHYAVQDIHYLLPLAQELKAALAARGLLFCVQEENELLSQVRPEAGENTPLYLNFKGASQLDPRSLAVLDRILRFRDREARQRDCPHFKVLGNQAVMAMARIKPVTEKDLRGIDGLSPKLVHKLGRHLIEAVKEGLQLPETALPAYPRVKRPRLHPETAARVQALKRWRAQKTAEWGVDPALILTNAQIQAIAAVNPKSPADMTAVTGVRRWQVTRFGADICSLFHQTG